MIGYFARRFKKWIIVIEIIMAALAAIFWLVSFWVSYAYLAEGLIDTNEIKNIAFWNMYGALFSLMTMALHVVASRLHDIQRRTNTRQNM